MLPLLLLSLLLPLRLLVFSACQDFLSVQDILVWCVTHSDLVAIVGWARAPDVAKCAWDVLHWSQ